MSGHPTRLEHDLLGEKAIPADAYYGVQTARALENFHISGVELRLYPDLIRALAMVKLAAARANFECGQFGKEILAGIEGACQEIIDGKLHDQFHARRVPGRRGHLHQHERQRGHREPRSGADGPVEGRLSALRPARSRQRVSIDERRIPDGAPRRHGARQRAARRRDQRPDRLVPREGAGVRDDSQDGAHPAPGRRAHDARPGVRRVRRDPGRRGARARGHAASALRGQHGSDRDRHGLERARRATRRSARSTWRPSRACPSTWRRISSRRRRTRRPSCSTRPA